MAAWHYPQLSNIHSVWSPSPGNLLCDRTSGAEVINHYTHPRAAAWHLSSRTATKATQWILPDLWVGSTRALQKFQSPSAAGKVPILDSSGRSLRTELPETQTQPTGSMANGFLSRHWNYCITITCWPVRHPSVRMWTLWRKEQRCIHLFPQFSTWCLVLSS